MNWETKQAGSTVVISCRISDPDWRRVADALSHFWEKLMSAVENTLPIDSWDRIGIEIWIDSGRVIAYPCKQNEKAKSDRAVVVQAIIDLLLEQSNALPDPEDSPTEFEGQATALELEVGTALLRSSRRKPGNAAISQLRSKNPFKVWVQSGDNTDSRRFTSV